MEEAIIGVVGTLQFDVFRYRMLNEYGVELVMTGLPYEHLRFIIECPGDPLKLDLANGCKVLEDYRGNFVIVFSGIWALNYIEKQNPGLVLSDELRV